MDGQPNIGTAACPPTEESVLAEARQAFEELVCFCLGEERTFWEFEKRLLVLLLGLGRVLTRLMLVHRHSRLSLEPYLAMKGYPVRRCLCRAETEDGLRGGQLWPSASDPRGRGNRFSSLGRGVGSDPGRFLAVGGAVRDAVGHADELFGQSSDL